MAPGGALLKIDGDLRGLRDDLKGCRPRGPDLGTVERAEIPPIDGDRGAVERARTAW